LRGLRPHRSARGRTLATKRNPCRAPPSNRYGPRRYSTASVLNTSPESWETPAAARVTATGSSAATCERHSTVPTGTCSPSSRGNLIHEAAHTRIELDRRAMMSAHRYSVASDKERRKQLAIGLGCDRIIDVVGSAGMRRHRLRVGTILEARRKAE